jgi:hypothetical protein
MWFKVLKLKQMDWNSALKCSEVRIFLHAEAPVVPKARSGRYSENWNCPRASDWQISGEPNHLQRVRMLPMAR